MTQRKGYQICRSASVALAALFTLSSCTPHTNYTLPLSEAQPFSSSGIASVPDQWWLVFNDLELNSHIEAGLGNNFSLAAAYERLEAARAIARKENSRRMPRLDALAGIVTFWGNTPQSEQYSLGLAASYEVDLWGQIRAATKAEDLRAAASHSAYRAAALLLSAQIADTWIRLVESVEQQQLLHTQIETNETILKVLQGRFGVGLVRSSDVLRQQLLIEGTRDELIALQAQTQVLQHQLSVLRGQPPQAPLPYTIEGLPELPPLPDTGLPSELIQRRPDVQAAAMAIGAADQDLAVAVRDQYPSLNLSASYLSEATQAGALFSNWIGTLSGSVIAPLLDGAERQAEIERSEAVRSELIHLYSQQVLNAFQEVEDALHQENKQAERIENLQGRLVLAQHSLEQIQTGYLNGASEFVSLLLAQLQLEEIERSLLSARRDLILLRLQLYRALAGGFKTPQEIIDQQEINQ